MTPGRVTPTRRVSPGRVGRYVGLALTALLALPFVLYAARFGLRGLTQDLSAESYLFAPPAPITAALAGHMLAGAALTLLVPLQLVTPLRRKWPGFHRATGRFLVALALIAAAGGSAYIAVRGTIGGPVMSAGFTLYGVLTALAAIMAWRLARAGDFTRHRRWALRLFVLAMGSWLFRLHYALWHLATGGLGSTPTLDGTFDRVQVVAFYLPYLLALEFYFRAGANRPEAA